MGFFVFSSVTIVGLFVAVGLAGVLALAVVTAIRNRNGDNARGYEPTMSEIQTRMSQLAAEIRALEQSDSLSRSHHIKAAQIAYDGLLAEACKRVGVPALANLSPANEPTAAQRQWAEAHSLDVVPEAAPRPSANRAYTDTERLERELSLAELGFVW